MDRDNDLDFLSSRAGFNTALRHFKTVTGLVSEVQEGGNFADLLADSLENDRIQRFQMRSMLNAVLLDKFHYASRPHNLMRTVEDVAAVVTTLSRWNNINFVLAYYHPQDGLTVLNPAQADQWAPVLPLVKDEYCVVYAGAVSDETNQTVIETATSDFITLLYGEKVPARKGYTTQKGVKRELPEAEPDSPPVEPERPEPPSPPVQKVPAAGRRVTPKYSVIVSNELFHNGNVESWKKIIQSYQTRYPGLDVLIWYENERINDINALFKWGKVKHGVPILFSVAGTDIRDVSKLQRYLYEGASSRFEVFLRGEYHKALDLF